jgi:hypothetical protein
MASEVVGGQVAELHQLGTVCHVESITHPEPCSKAGPPHYRERLDAWRRRVVAAHS